MLTEKKPKQKTPAEKRSYLSQADVPGVSLDQALRVCQAIADSYGKNPTRPLRVAEAMKMSPSSGGFRMLCGASIAYGLTEGGYNSEQIAITPLGRRIVAPTKEGDDLAARREALLRPRVVREFLTRYNESKLPSETIARNMLEEMRVPADRTAAVFTFLVEGARSAGFLREVKGQLYVDLDRFASTIEPVVEPDKVDEEEPATNESRRSVEGSGQEGSPAATPPARRSGRVFITHGRNEEIVDQLKDLLTFGGFTPVVAMEHETTSKPISDKVMDDMRTCGAAIIHVGTEAKMLDADGKEQRMLNQNVLIEIGAALALYGRNFILLVERGVILPSNLHGLYEVRYQGEKLDYDSTMKLLKAFNDFRS